MNRADLQKLSTTRLREAQLLFTARGYSGVYYLSGYAIECALKARYAKGVNRYDFPTRSNLFIHNLGELVKLVELPDSLVTS